MIKDKIIYIHIPKAGGGTFKEVLLQIYGDTLLQESISEELYEEKWKYNKHYKDFQVIKGHFNINKYLHLYPEWKFITILRHPVDRMISHYFHIQRMRSNPVKIGKNFKATGINANQNIVEYTRSWGNMMTLYMGNDLQRYSFIGIQEDFIGSLNSFVKIFDLPNIKWSSIKNRNTSPTKNIISEFDKEQMTEILKDDIDLYEEAVCLYNDRFRIPTL